MVSNMIEGDIEKKLSGSKLVAANILAGTQVSPNSFIEDDIEKNWRARGWWSPKFWREET